MANALLHVPTSAALYDAALEGLAGIDTELIREGHVPPLYSTNVVYRTEPRDVWRHALDVVKEGWGDCEDLSAYRVGELRASGEDPGARVRTFQTGPRQYHAVVERGDGTIEDPSYELGMHVPDSKKGLYMRYNRGQSEGPGMWWEDPEENVGGEDEGRVTVDVYRHNGGWTGVIRFPMPTGRVLAAATSTAATKAEAVKKTGNVAIDAAKALADSPLAEVLPPGTQTAIKVLASPAGRAAVDAVTGGAKGAVNALKSLF